MAVGTLFVFAEKVVPRLGKISVSVFSMMNFELLSRSSSYILIGQKLLCRTEHSSIQANFCSRCCADSEYFVRYLIHLSWANVLPEQREAFLAWFKCDTSRHHFAYRYSQQSRTKAAFQLVTYQIGDTGIVSFSFSCSLVVNHFHDRHQVK